MGNFFKNLFLLMLTLPIVANATPDVEVFFRGNTYFAKVRPNTTYPADCTVQFIVQGETSNGPGGRAYLNDVAGKMFSEALGGNVQSPIGVKANAYCTISAAEKDRLETKRKQEELRRNFEKQRVGQKKVQRHAASSESELVKRTVTNKVGVACPNSSNLRGNITYPHEALRDGITGSFTVEFTVKASGEINNATVIGSANPFLARAALDTVNKFKCIGQGQDVIVQVPFSFKLE